MTVAIVMPCLVTEYEQGQRFMSVAAYMAGMNTYQHIEVDRHKRGFIQTANRGMAYMRDLFDLDYVLLLNADACPCQPAWLARLVEVAEEDPKIGFVGPSIPCGTAPQNGGRVGMSAGVEAVRRLNFSCTLVRNAVIADIGLMDERYIHYGGDYAWLHAAQERGWTAVWVRDVWVWHDWQHNRFPEWIEADRALFYSEWTQDGHRCS